MHSCCRAYDRAAYKLRPFTSHFNFPDTDYSQDDFVKVRAHDASAGSRSEAHKNPLLHPILVVQKYGRLDKYEFVQRLRNWAQVSEQA